MRRTSPAHERVAIFVDFDNLKSSRAENFGVYLEDGELIVPPEMTKEELSRIRFIPDELWQNFNDIVLTMLMETTQEATTLSHMGTWLAVGKKPKPTESDTRFYYRLELIDYTHGFLFMYGIKIMVSVRTARGGSRMKYQDRGVDTKLVCQMLAGAMEDQYDICVLFSDDKDFMPVIMLIQNRFGKRVYHAGYDGRYLRPIAYSHLALEKRSPFFEPL